MAGPMTHDPADNLYTKRTEKEFFKELEDAAVARGKVAVLLKGFCRAEINMLIDARAYKMKQASREHTIQVCISSICRCLPPTPRSVRCGAIWPPQHDLRDSPERPSAHAPRPGATKRPPDLDTTEIALGVSELPALVRDRRPTALQTRT